jgi:tetratricopeptide (TPR) repeat protein
MKSFNFNQFKKLAQFSLPRLINMKNFYSLKKFAFSGCENSGCGCHPPKNESEIEKSLKAKNYEIIQCINSGKFEEALNLSDDFISVVKSNFGDEHPFYCSALNNKAFILKSCGDYAEAKPLFEEVIAKYKTLYGENNEKTVISLHNLGTLLKESKEYEASVKIYESLLKIIEKEHLKIEGEQTGNLRLNIVANIYNSAGGLYRQLKNYKESERLLKLAYDVVKENFGERTIPIGAILNNMALSDKDQGFYEKAKQKYEKALDIFSSLLPPDHPELKMTKENLDKLKQERSDSFIYKEGSNDKI